MNHRFWDILKEQISIGNKSPKDFTTKIMVSWPEHSSEWRGTSRIYHLRSPWQRVNLTETKSSKTQPNNSSGRCNHLQECLISTETIFVNSCTNYRHVSLFERQRSPLPDQILYVSLDSRDESGTLHLVRPVCTRWLGPFVFAVGTTFTARLAVDESHQRKQ